MPSRLVNVRLDEARLRKVKRLREHGMALSDVVREAVDGRFADLIEQRRPIDAIAVVEKAIEQYPDPPDIPPRDYDVADAHAARAAIIAHLRRKK